MKLSLLFIAGALSAELVEERDIVSDVLGPWINDITTGTYATQTTSEGLIFTTPTTRVTRATSANDEFPTFTTPTTTSSSTTARGFFDGLFAPASTSSSSSSVPSTLSEYPSNLLVYLTRSSQSSRSSTRSTRSSSSSTSEYPSQLLAYLTRDASSVASSVASDISSVASEISSVASSVESSIESSSSSSRSRSTKATTTESNDLLQYLTGSETFYPSNLVAYINSRTTRGSSNDTTQTTVAAQQTVVTGSISFQSTVSDTMSSEDAANRLLGPVLGSMAVILISLI
ncbi:hypothetical protein CLIB1444_02S16028 [[Candida] jaroonii]|uniref:Uncharacterized protein n=1 Tax=[Candida] jaroonii TaxID=467808 RepID=A0ACA9Y4A4_9ASCO|nr:hypothetical protein CLIB1444_02S16028 [[Candida] jaroonii]